MAVNRYIIAEMTPSETYRVDFDFTAEDWEAELSFRTLYKGMNGYVLFKQAAVIDCEPAGSCDEADDAAGKSCVFTDAQLMARSLGK